MPGYCKKIKDPVKRAECNRAGYANKTKKAKKAPKERKRSIEDKIMGFFTRTN